MRKLLTTVALLVPSLAWAQPPVIEITPFLGYRWGGSFSADDSLLLPYDVDVEPTNSFGVALDFPISRHFQMQLLFDRQSTDLTTDGWLFEPDEVAVGMDLTYYHLGFIWQFPARQWRPYVVLSVGLAHMNPDLPGVRSEQRLSGGLGGGIKLDLSEHVGFRFEGRSFWTNTSDGHWWDWSCDDHWDNCDWRGDRDLVQSEFSAGIVLSF